MGAVSAVGDTVNFNTPDALWKSDGTVGGTVRVASVFVKYLCGFAGNRLMFIGSDDHDPRRRPDARSGKQRSDVSF